MAQDVSAFGDKLAKAKLDKSPLMQRIVLVVQGESERRTPVKTGTLKRSETTRVDGSGERGYVGTNVAYARFVHDGTKSMVARPFFKEGMAASRDTVIQLMNDAGQKFFKDLIQ